MNAWENYLKGAEEIIRKIQETQQEAILSAADILTQTTENGGLIYGFGVGHSYHVVGDAFWRASTPANYYGLVEQSATGNYEITKSNLIENTYDIGRYIVDYHRITPQDCMIIISNSGNNIVPVDAAIRAKEKGIPVIGITAVEYSGYLKAKHKSGLKLKDIADVVLDNCSRIGDAMIDIPGFPMKVGSTSTIPNVLLQNMVLCQMVENLVKKGLEPDVYYNGHLAFMDEKCAEHNQALVDKYFWRIRSL